jgi:hypothetical protein
VLGIQGEGAWKSLKNALLFQRFQPITPWRAFFASVSLHEQRNAKTMSFAETSPVLTKQTKTIAFAKTNPLC